MIKHQATSGPERAEAPWTTPSGLGSHSGVTDRGLAPTATHGPPLRGDNMLVGLGRSPVGAVRHKYSYFSRPRNPIPEKLRKNKQSHAKTRKEQLPCFLCAFA